MEFVIAQPWVQLLGAGGLGFVCGWLFRLLFSMTRQRGFVRDWGSRVRVAEHTRDRYEQEAREASTELAALKEKHKKSAGLVAEIEAELKNRDATILELEHELATWRKRGPMLESLVQERDRTVSRLEYELAEAKRGEPEQESSDEDLSVEALEMQLEEWHGRLPALESSLVERDAALAALSKEVADWRAAHADLEGTLAAHTAKLTSLERELGERNAAEREPAGKDREQTITMLATELDEWKRKHALLERRLKRQAVSDSRAEEKPVVIDNVPAGGRDNLKKIRGIGPALEGTLNGLGIYRFQQIAELSEEDITDIAGKLKTFPDRIRRDKWVDQARELQDAAKPRSKTL